MSQGRRGDVPSRPRLGLRAKGCGPPRRKARTEGPRCSRSWLECPGSAVYPGSAGVPESQRCTQGRWVLPGAGGCSRVSRSSRSRRALPGPAMLPGFTSNPGFSGRSPRPALSPRRRERRLREAPGDRAGLPEAGRVLQALLEIHRHLHLSSTCPRRRRRRSSGSCGSGGAEERWHRGSGRRRRALGRL